VPRSHCCLFAFFSVVHCSLVELWAVSLDYKREWFPNGTIALFDYVVKTLYNNDLITLSLDFSIDTRTPRSPVRILHRTCLYCVW
jgi:hypothetical protein